MFSLLLQNISIIIFYIKSDFFKVLFSIKKFYIINFIIEILYLRKPSINFFGKYIDRSPSLYSCNLTACYRAFSFRA